MTEYTFHVSESLVTSTTTATLGSTDPVLVYSNSAIHTAQSTIGSVSSLWNVTSATSATTGTNISSNGYTSLGSSSGPITAWLLDTPLATGISKTIQSVSTSTANTVTVSTTAVNTVIHSTDTWAGRTITFSLPGAFVNLMATAGTTNVWSVVDRSAAGVACT